MTTSQGIEAVDVLEDGCRSSAVGPPGALQDQSTSERGNRAEAQKQKTHMIYNKYMIMLYIYSSMTGSVQALTWQLQPNCPVDTRP
jgi:hypothetical protein